MRNKEIGWSKESSMLWNLMKEIKRLGVFVTSAIKGISQTTYTDVLQFSGQQDIFAENVSANFTLASAGNTNGAAKIYRLNTPVSVNFSSDFIAVSDSEAIDITKLNVIYFLYFSNWDGSGTPKVLYRNNIFDAV